MPPKRARRASPAPTGLSAGERLKRAKLSGNTQYTAWGWVGTEVTDASEITQEHRLATCGFSKNSIYPLCANKYSVVAQPAPAKEKATGSKAAGELEDDVIVISDDEGPSCSSRGCKGNPYCLNYLGQEKWEDKDKAREAFMKAADLGEDPVVNSRDPGSPVGLKNLGATCFANASLQVWFQDLPFRNGVYKCQPLQDADHKYEESPVFQLQVTFAAMQESIQSAFNPVKLVESLKLRTTEQQDAQEFSKLFMAHLDTEFQKQSSPVLKSLVADQFQGKQVYGTICEKCHNRSERASDFLEVEVNLENNSTLEERIAAVLQPETLSGDNQYSCPRCESLQDARRYTELRQLPPVLHFSLLRFVYDVSSMERRKCKHAISFPMSLDMTRFLGSVDARKSYVKKGMRCGDNLYELRGVLLHKGTSAYHGHYEAQVFDVQNQAWYQFNDETVTKIDSLGAKMNGKGKAAAPAEGDLKKKPATQVPKPPRGNQRKRRRIEDSDSEIEIIEKSPTPPNEEKKTPERPVYNSSRDAYMLIYSRVTKPHSLDAPSLSVNGGSSRVSPGSRSDSPREPSTAVPTPPARALEVVTALNASHDEACEEYAKKERETKARFCETRKKVMNIYRTWSLSSRDEESIVASRQALKTWMTGCLAKPGKRKPSPSRSGTSTPSAEKAKSSDDENEDFMSAILCAHGRLNPDKASDMKLVKKAAYERILSDNWSLDPLLPPSEVCEICVDDAFAEHLYQVEHPRLVTRFDEVSAVDEDEQGYWISKPWLKDWRLTRPKMHVASQPDPPPDAEEFEQHVVCEHGGVTANIAFRRRISAEACAILHDLFPGWQAVPTNTEICPVCQAMAHISKEDKREIRRQAEEEKAKLKHMHDNALNGNTQLLENVPCAIVPAQFVRSWRQWLLRPGEVPRPDSVDNSQFICEHGLLSFDPNLGSDLDSSVALIKRSDWDVLEDLYSGGPLIAVENTGGKLVHDLSVCDGCRRKKKSTFDMTEITVRILGPKDPIPTVETFSEESIPPPHRLLHGSTMITYGSRNTGGVRQSNRIRQGKDLGKRRRVTITKTMTVKDLKILFQEEFKIPTISQRLFHHGRELDDSSASVLSLGILTNDLLDLREESEDVSLLSDSDDEHAKRKRKNEGRGFGGTLLGGVPQAAPEAKPVEPPRLVPTTKSCLACTFDNPVDVTSCTICDTPFT
ncbi:cysteine proteinase [Amylocystis lapponica]|nr:cysteine proteinase [Amylocystis lapponica]